MRTSGPSSTRASSSCPGSACCRRPTPTWRGRSRWSTPSSGSRSAPAPAFYRYGTPTPRHRGRLRRLPRRRPHRLLRRGQAVGRQLQDRHARPGSEQGLRPHLAGARRRAGRARGGHGRRRRGARHCGRRWRAMTSGVGLIPEQAWENAEPGTHARTGTLPPECASIGFVNGKPAGSTSPLTWSRGAVRAAVGEPARGAHHRAARGHRQALHHPHPGWRRRSR